MSTLRPKPFSVDLERDFCVDLLNFDLNNSTLLIPLAEEIEYEELENEKFSLQYSMIVFFNLLFPTAPLLSYIGIWRHP